MRVRSALTAVAAGTISLPLMAGVALASDPVAVFGNAATDRTHVDSYQNFSIVDTNNSVDAAGTVTAFNYFAERTGTIRFLIVGDDGVVDYVSGEIVVSAAGAGTFTPASPVTVAAGDNLGVYSATAGVISYDDGGEPAFFTPNNHGVPTTGSAQTQGGAVERTYSMNATYTPADPVKTKDDCKDGGWATFGDFKNQGQCVSSFVRQNDV